jgi:hypothetical protein
MAAVAVAIGSSGCSSSSSGPPALVLAGTLLTPVYRQLVDYGISSGAVSNRGVVFLSSPSDGKVVVLSIGGDSSGTIGRSGDGPCEFRSITDFAPVGDGAVAIAEARQGRLQICEQGSLAGVTLLVPGQILGLVAAGADSIVFAAKVGADTIAVFRVARTSQAQGFVPVDTIAVWRTDTIATRLNQPKTQIPILTVRRNGTIIAASSADSVFRILEFSSEGEISTVADRVEAPILYTDIELQERRDWIQRTIKRSGRPVPPPLPIAKMKRVKPMFSWKSLGVDGSGALWARPASAQDTVVPILVFRLGSAGPTRRFLVAPPVRDIAVADGFLATFGENSDGLGVVALYRIPR